MHFGVLRFRILGDASGPGGFGVFVVVFLADIRVLGDPVFFHRLIFGGCLRGGGLDSGFPPACGAQDTPQDRLFPQRVSLRVPVRLEVFWTVPWSRISPHCHPFAHLCWFA